jgi:hypothetical protein
MLMSDEREMIVCIPGPWQKRGELSEVLSKSSGGRYTMAGLNVLDSEENDFLPIEWESHDPRMRQAFHACRGYDETLAAIEDHQSVVYARFPMDMRKQRQRLLKFTAVLRDAGGIAIKLENCGLSHPWQRWFEWMSAPFENSHYRAAVVVVHDSSGWYSCGMHHFCLPDAIVHDAKPDARETLEAFNKYLLLEAPELKTGHTFGKDAEAIRRRLRWTEDERFPADDLFHNPHGVWNLDP